MYRLACCSAPFRQLPCFDGYIYVDESTRRNRGENKSRRRSFLLRRKGDEISRGRVIVQQTALIFILLSWSLTASTSAASPQCAF